jgi:phospholipase C
VATEGAEASAGADQTGPSAVKHVIVLALENRSFDHLLGYLKHPDADFDGLGGASDLFNRLDPLDPDSPSYPPEPSATEVLPLDPDHEHYAVLGQIERVAARDNVGFVRSYAHKQLETARQEIRRHMLRVWAKRVTSASGLIALLLSLLGKWVWSAVAAALGLAGLAMRWVNRCNPITPEQQKKAEAVAPLIMHCFAPERVPVISQLATQFALCQRWFCSLPGETWPNRNFFHAASSAGSVNIELGLYPQRTIFEVLSEAEGTWRVYYGQFPPQVFAFPYVLKRSIHNSRSLADLLNDLEQGDLPNYSFVEPHHGLLGKRPSCSQHPGNNLRGKQGGADFRAGERLIAEIYQRLRTNPKLFAQTVFVITYDEHGGTYDHIRPPAAVAPGKATVHWTRKLIRWLVARAQPLGFNFRRLGVRVPCVVISPWIRAHTLDSHDRDHTSITATLRSRFAA